MFFNFGSKILFCLVIIVELKKINHNSMIFIVMHISYTAFIYLFSCFIFLIEFIEVRLVNKII